MHHIKLFFSIFFALISLIFIGNVFTGHYIFEKECCPGGPSCTLENICTNENNNNEYNTKEIIFFGTTALSTLVIAFLLGKDVI